MSRIIVEIDTTDLSQHKDISLLEEALSPYYNWAIKRVALIDGKHKIEINLKPHMETSNKKVIINLLKYLYGDYSKARLAKIMGISISEFAGRFNDYLDEIED